MEDVVKIKGLVEQYKEAIHTQDEVFFKNLWTNEEGNTMISITHQYTGLESIYQEFLKERIQGNYLKITLIQDGELKIHFLSDDIAIVIFEYHTECIKRDTLEEYGIEGLETQVVKKVDNE